MKIKSSLSKKFFFSVYGRTREITSSGKTDFCPMCSYTKKHYKWLTWVDLWCWCEAFCIQKKLLHQAWEKRLSRRNYKLKAASSAEYDYNRRYFGFVNMLTRCKQVGLLDFVRHGSNIFSLHGIKIPRTISPSDMLSNSLLASNRASVRPKRNPEKLAGE